MTRRPGLLLFLLLAGIPAVLSACRQDVIVEVPDSLKTVTILGPGMILEKGGSAEATFRVQDPGFEFNYNVNSSLCQVMLRTRDGSAPTHFRLASVSKLGDVGLYTAVITDSGSAEAYSEQACITIVQRGESGAESYISSGFMNVSSAAPEFSVKVETGLPVVYIDTENGKPVTSKTVEIPAVLKIKGEMGYADLYPANCTIRGRGNTTWTWPKKPYLVKMESQTSLLGMPKHKRWVLLANFMDRTMMRNLVSMKVASLTSLAWTPRCVPVELVLNGKHVGNYLLIEQVRVDNDRVDISEETGYLLELDFHYDNKFQWKDHGIPFAVKYPDPDELKPEQKTYIKKYIADIAAAIYGNSFKDPLYGYEAWLDVDSFVDYWIVYEVMGNHELGNPGSVFFHTDASRKLTAGPCWDFDWGVLSYNTSPHARTGFVNRHAIWYDRLFQDPAFAAKVRDRFQQLLPSLQTIPAYIDECEKLLQKSSELNFKMWDPAQDASQNGGHIINGDEKMTYNDAVARLRKIYQERLVVIDSQL